MADFKAAERIDPSVAHGNVDGAVAHGHMRLSRIRVTLEVDTSEEHLKALHRRRFADLAHFDAQRMRKDEQLSNGAVAS